MSATGFAAHGFEVDRRMSVRGPIARLYADEPIFTVAALAMVGLMLPTAMAALVDGRMLHGIDVWLKPFKFQVALATYLLTLAFYARWLPPGMTARRGYRVYSAVVVAAITAEMVWISGASAHGVGSHFNEATPLMTWLYRVMGPLAVVLTSPTMVYAVAIARNREFRAGPAARAALVLGLGLVLPLTLITAGTLAQNGGHWVGGTPDDSLGLAVMGWSRDGGDLRVPHFFATHAMHFVPAFGLLSITLLGRERRWPVVAFAAAYVAITLAVFVQALAGRPFPFG
jgi:hypothetical protein